MPLPKGVPVLAYGGRSVIPIPSYNEVVVDGLPCEAEGTVYALMMRVPGTLSSTSELFRIGEDSGDTHLRPIYMNSHLAQPSVEAFVTQVEMVSAVRGG